VNNSNLNALSIGIYVALPQEAQPIISQFGMTKSNDVPRGLPIERYTGAFKGVPLTLYTAGKDRRYGVPNIGPEIAFLATHVLIERETPKLILNPGVAGGAKALGCKVNEIYVGQGSVGFHDRHSPVELYEKYLKGEFPICDFPVLRNSRHLKFGLLSSGASFDHKPEEAKTLVQAGIRLKDMEGASVAWACHLHNTPFLPIKVVSDFYDDPTPFADQFYANFPTACALMGNGVKEVIQTLADTRPE
jgi:nucleoside phosphorylase